MNKKLTFVLALLILGQIVSANNWLRDFETAKKMALATNKLILVDFWASWCGPCKKMDIESWSKEDVKTLMASYVPVQIDIDANKSLAKQYNVRGIPFIFILDGNGKVVYQSMSYKTKSQVLKLLKDYALSTEYLNAELISYYKKSNFVSAYRLAKKYQDYSLYLGKSLRIKFLNTADFYFDEALNYLDKDDLNNKEGLRQKIALFAVQKEVYKNNTKKALRLLGKIDAADVVEMNSKLYAFLCFATHTLNNDKKKAENWATKVDVKAKEKLKLISNDA